MQGVEFTLAALERVGARLLQELLGAQTQEAREVDRPRGAGALTVEVAREEIVERTRGVLGVLGGEVFGHFSPVELESKHVKFRNLSTLVSS